MDGARVVVGGEDWGTRRDGMPHANARSSLNPRQMQSIPSPGPLYSCPLSGHTGKLGKIENNGDNGFWTMVSEQ